MLIDWFTVGAQVLNFTVLVWLMQHFLYKPILDAIDAREEGIAKKLAEAKAQKTHAQQEREEFERKNEVFDQERTALLSKATEEVKTEGVKLLEQAYKEIEGWSVQRQEALQNEAKNLNHSITRRIQDEAFNIAGKILTDLAGVTLENRVVEVFTRHLQELTDKAKSDLGAALGNPSEPVVLRSAFVLSQAQKKGVYKCLQEVFPGDIELQFETASDLIAGIDLIANGYKVAWSIADYLSLLEKDVGELLASKQKPGVKTQAESGGTSP